MSSVKIPSVCIPRVHVSMDAEGVGAVFNQVFEMNIVNHVDMVQRTDRNTEQPFYVAYVHFNEMKGKAKIEKFNESSLSCQKYLLGMATMVDRNKLKLVGQRMREMDREEENRLLRQEVKNEIDLLSLQSERLEAEYRSLVTTLEKQKSLLKKLSSE